jgi:serine/threonine protein kinase
VLHRDLKPGNVFVGTGQTLKVGDFGMSRYVDLAAAAGALVLGLATACCAWLAHAGSMHGDPLPSSCMLDRATHLRST